MARVDPSSADGTILYPIQYARAFAALAVFYYHISATVASTYADAEMTVDAVGAAGVDLFFVVSGFVMALVVARTPTFDATAFMAARARRIVPLYWFLTLLVFAVVSAAPGLLNGPDATPGRLVHSLAFLPYGVDAVMTPVLLVGWTLNYEMFFYALVALGAGLFGDRDLKLAGAAICALVGVGLLWSPSNGYAQFYTDPIMLEFVLGTACYHVWRATQSFARSPVWPVMCCAAIAVLALQFEADAGRMRALFWGVPSAMLLLGGLHAITWRSEALRRLGDWSYSLYLVHLFVVVLTVRYIVPHAATAGVPWWAHYAWMTAAVIALSYGVHKLVERPLSRSGFARRAVASRRSSLSRRRATSG